MWGALIFQLRVYTLNFVSDKPDLSITRECYCLAARRKARALTRFYEEQLRPHGLRATQFSILAALMLKGPTPISELAELLGLERTTLTRAAEVMKRNGWIEPEPADDGRVHALRLTQTGLRKLTEAYPAWEQAQQAVADNKGPNPGRVGRPAEA